MVASPGPRHPQPLQPFLPSPHPHRVAAFVGEVYPVAHAAPGYERLDRLAAALAVDVFHVHTHASDPSREPMALRSRYGDGLLVPDDARICCNDVEHLRRVRQDRFDAMVATLAPLLGESEPAMIARPEFQRACSAARWLCGLAPRWIVSFGLGDHALQAMIASHLSGVPRLSVLDSQTIATAPSLLGLDVHQATAVLVGDADGEAAVDGALGGPGNARVFALTADGEPPPALIERLRAHIDDDDAGGDLGPAAAWRTDRAAQLAPETRERLFVVIGAERTGTTMLQGLLASHPELTSAGELFNPRAIDKDQITWLPGPDDGHHEERLALRHARPAELLDRLVREGTARGHARTGFKLLYYHGLIDDRVLDALLSAPEIPIVHLLRADRLRRHVSLLHAARSDRWVANRGDPRPPRQPLQPDPRALVADLTRTALFEARYRSMFSRHRVLELTYEELVRDRDAALTRIGDHLGHRLCGLEPHSRRTASRDLADDVVDLPAVRGWLRGTRWSSDDLEAAT